jgi:hypothetical protein
MQQLYNWIKEVKKEPHVIEELKAISSAVRQLKRITTSSRFVRNTPWQILRKIYQLLIELDKLTSHWLVSYKEALEEAHREIFDSGLVEDDPSSEEDLWQNRRQNGD